MKLAEVFAQLAYGELSQINLGSHAEGELTEANYPQLVANVNLGLTALYTRFHLKESSLVFPLQAGSVTYQLQLADLLKITEVRTVNEADVELGLNDSLDPYSCYTPKLNTLVVPARIVEGSSELPDELKTTSLKAVYRANHPLLALVNGFIDPETTEVELPYSHLEALLYFVASRIHNPIGMVNEFHAGNSWAAKYEAKCKQLEDKNLQVDQGRSSTRLENKGWV